MTDALIGTVVFALLCAKDIPAEPIIIAAANINFFMTDLLLLNALASKTLYPDAFEPGFLLLIISLVVFITT